MITLILKAVKPALSRCIIPAISLTTHRATYAKLSRFIPERLAGVLTSSVGMMVQTQRRLFTEPCHTQRGREDIGGHARLELPAHDCPVEQV